MSLSPLEVAVAAIEMLAPGEEMAKVASLLSALSDGDLCSDLLSIQVAESRVHRRLRYLKVPRAARLAAVALRMDLDEEVEERPGKPGSGSPLVLKDPEPWPDPVDGAQLLNA